MDDQLTFNQLIEWNGTIGDRKHGYLYPVRAAPGRTLLEMAAPSGMATTEKLDLVKLNSKVVAYLARHEARDKLCR